MYMRCDIVHSQRCNHCAVHEVARYITQTKRAPTGDAPRRPLAEIIVNPSNLIPHINILQHLEPDHTVQRNATERLSCAQPMYVY